MAGIAACFNRVVGVKESSRTYEGAIEITNALPEAVALTIKSASLVLDRVLLHKEEAVQPGATFTYDAGCTKHFDFYVEVRTCEGSSTATRWTVSRAVLIRTASYRIVEAEAEQKPEEKPSEEAKARGGARLKARFEQVRAPARECSNRLADIKGISFSFSASGWLFMYQLGVAECLQDHGICRNPYVELSGASGGALTAATMIYGCSMPLLRDTIKAAAAKVHKDPSQAWNLRRFVVDACFALDVRDGSYMHPAFQEGRVQICFSETELTRTGIVVATLLGQVRQNRARSFEDTAAVVVALLASCTMGISGMPFTMRNAEGKQVKVADGACTSFLPTVDNFSVKVKPFSDGLGILGGRSELMTSEWIPSIFGLYPAQEHEQDHLYELGYRDAQVWVEDCLAARVKKINAAPKEKAPRYRDVPDRPPVEFDCKDDGKAWQDKVTRSVPVEWGDMKNEDGFHASMETKPLLVGSLCVELGTSARKGSGMLAKLARTKSRLLPSAPGPPPPRLLCAVTRSELRWGLEAPLESRGAPAAGALGEGAAEPCRGEAGDAGDLELGPRGGKMAVPHIKNVERTDRRPNVVVVNTYSSEYVRLTAESPEDAKRWQSEIKLAIEEQRRAAQEKSNCRPDKE